MNISVAITTTMRAISGTCGPGCYSQTSPHCLTHSGPHMSTTIDVELQNAINEWLEFDPNPATRAEIEQLVTNSNVSELKKRLGQRITFGTAGIKFFLNLFLLYFSLIVSSSGLRGPMQAGSSCMNTLTVIQASQVT